MNRPRILYIGNMLKKWGNNPTSVDFLGEKLEKDFEVIRISSYQNIVFRLLDIWKTLILCHKKVDIVLIDTYSTKSFFFAWTSGRLASLFKLKYIPILHGGNLPSRLIKSKKIFQRFLNDSHVVISPSEYLKQSLNQIEEIPIQIIPNSIDLGKYPYTQRPNLDKIKIVWLRAFDKIYNPHLAIKLVHYLVKNGEKNVSLTMIGPDKDGSMEQCIKLSEDLGIKDLVHFTGGLSFNSWLPIVQKGNVFINTTNVDNMPVSLIESMALGVPVISTKVGGIPHLVKDGYNGLLVAPDSPSKFGEAILKLKRNPKLYRDLSDNGRKSASKYSWNKINNQWKTILNSVD